ncbi:Hypothetical predicted protein [Podarcis lilfordi]|uniref:Uncharacterized protein n=1 Tax=Podarcis lilfordi TaxID=74358 RepID=A0AA35JVE3_9SAUR|nr:Hypothetical predicted protein [Podarcis lilfordi]
MRIHTFSRVPLALRMCGAILLCMFIPATKAQWIQKGPTSVKFERDWITLEKEETERGGGAQELRGGAILRQKRQGLLLPGVQELGKAQKPEQPLIIRRASEALPGTRSSTRRSIAKAAAADRLRQIRPELAVTQVFVRRSCNKGSYRKSAIRGSLDSFAQAQGATWPDLDELNTRCGGSSSRSARADSWS